MAPALGPHRSTIVAWLTADMSAPRKRWTPEKLNRFHGGDLADHRGYVVDVSTIAGALLGRKMSLKETARILGTEHQKLDVDLGRPIDGELLTYAMNDVQATCGIRGVAVPGILIDFLSQYPTVSTLMGAWRFHIASKIEAIDEPTSGVEALLARGTTDDVLDSALWQQLGAIVLIEPTASRLPTRAHFGEPKSGRRRGSGSTARTRNLALPIRADRLAQW